IDDLRSAHVVFCFITRDAADLANDVSHALGFSQDDFHRVSEGLIPLDAPFQVLGVTHDACERLIELMGSCAGNLCDSVSAPARLKLLLSEGEAFLHGELFADISEDADGSHRAAAALDQAR